MGHGFERICPKRIVAALRCEQMTARDQGGRALIKCGCAGADGPESLWSARRRSIPGRARAAAGLAPLFRALQGNGRSRNEMIDSTHVKRNARRGGKRGEQQQVLAARGRGRNTDDSALEDVKGLSPFLLTGAKQRLPRFAGAYPQGE